MQRRQGTAANGVRASVKNQRRVNNQQPAARSGAKKKPQPQKENSSKQPSAPVGVSGMALSARFSSLQKEAVQSAPVAAKKKNVVVNIKKPGQQTTKKVAKQQQKAQQQQKQQQQKQKMQEVAQANRSKRQEKVNQGRKGLALAAAASKGAMKNSKPNGTAAVKPKSKNGAKPKGEKKKPITGEDLDVEMDTYWHQAGKGPDPQQALLDRQMEEYWAGKPKREGESAHASETTSS